MAAGRCKELMNNSRKTWTLTDEEGREMDDVLIRTIEESLKTKEEEDRQRRTSGNKLQQWMNMSYDERVVSSIAASESAESYKEIIQDMPKASKEQLVKRLTKDNLDPTSEEEEKQQFELAIKLSMDQQQLRCERKPRKSPDLDEHEEEEDLELARAIEDSKRVHEAASNIENVDPDLERALKLSVQQQRTELLQQINLEREISRNKQRRRGSRRPIVIDAANVAYHHSNHTRFSPRGILVAYNYFDTLGHKDIVAFAIKPRKIDPEDAALLENFVAMGVVKIIPPRINAEGRYESHYDDYYILSAAKENGGIVVSNDKYRDVFLEYPDFHRELNSRLLTFQFNGDDFLPAMDPCGRGGPKLDKFLKF